MLFFGDFPKPKMLHGDKKYMGKSTFLPTEESAGNLFFGLLNRHGVPHVETTKKQIRLIRIVKESYCA